jgi:hypothetical protein
LFKDGKFNG